MAKLTCIEEEYFENLFEMGGGYVLDFSTQNFYRFIESAVDIDVSQRYQGLSKAKALRAFIKDFDDRIVGKLLLELLQYVQHRGKITDNNRNEFNKAVEVGNKLIGKTIKQVKQPCVGKSKEVDIQSVDYKKFLAELATLNQCNESPQSRGFAFEKYLKSLFEAEGLNPRGSFKIVGEQLDGSFELHNEVYLLEAKWTSKPIDKGNLVIFNEKVASKSSFTRGVYISYAGYTDEALSTFANGRTVRIVLMTVNELAGALSMGTSLKEFIWKKVRALAEEGEFNKQLTQM